MTLAMIRGIISRQSNDRAAAYGCFGRRRPPPRDYPAHLRVQHKRMSLGQAHRRLLHGGVTQGKYLAGGRVPDQKARLIQQLTEPAVSGTLQAGGDVSLYGVGSAGSKG